jgi:glycosyltransferase involved in cell wall biosynthesis
MIDSLPPLVAPPPASTLVVGLTTRHGMADEMARVPPEGVRYEFLEVKRGQTGWLRSPIKAALRTYDDQHVDLVESVLGITYTDRPWICSLDCFQAAMAMTLRGCPLPKSVRRRILERLFLRDNFKALVFWSQAALATLTDYGGLVHKDIIDKATVVYPAIRLAPDELTANPANGLRLLFSGDFFRKGGAHVVDAFHQIQRDFPDATLRLCCDERIDFSTPNRQLRDEYLAKISANPRIQLGRVSRDFMLEAVLPQTDIYLLPTYDEAFGFAILEAMSYGIPVIASNVFAIPEIIASEEHGLLIDVTSLDLATNCRGYVVQRIPPSVREEMSERLVRSITKLAASPILRTRIGLAARERVRHHFSFERRNREMSRIYSEAVV